MSYIMKFLLVLSFFSQVLAETISYEGTAREKGVIVYKEKHTHEFKDGKVVKSETIYTDPQGQFLGSLKSTYAQSLNIPEHEMIDKRAKNTHGVKYISGKPYMYSRDDSKEEKRELYEGEEKGKLSVAGQGLHFYMLSHLDELKEKKVQDLKFLIPGRLDSYLFKLKFIKQEGSLYHFDVEIDQWFLRLFAPKLVLIYDSKLKKLVKYTGLSNLKNKEGDLFNVEITYE